jgi:signal transduction histidine kinase
VKERLQWRLTCAFLAVALGVSALFGLFALGLTYTLEPYIFEKLLDEEMQRQTEYHHRNGRWASTDNPWIVLHASAATLPAELASLADTPVQRGVVGEQGRWHHVRSLGAGGGPPWLTMDVGREYLVKPMGRLLAGWLVAWAVALLALFLTAAWWLSRTLIKPVHRLASQLALARPGHLSQSLALGQRDDEVGDLARRFDELLARTAEFVRREQAFTRDVSHELRTPLSVLRIAIEGLQADVGISPHQRRQVTTMHAATAWMEQTVSALLLLAREEMTPTTVATPALALIERWVIAHAAWLDERGMTLKMQLSPNDRLPLPEPALRLVLAGLLANAFAHGDAGSAVQIGFGSQGLWVQNASPALPDGVGKAFVKGQASAGSGLGLSIVRGLLERYGAHLDISHSQGHTTARVRAGTESGRAP